MLVSNKGIYVVSKSVYLKEVFFRLLWCELKSTTRARNMWVSLNIAIDPVRKHSLEYNGSDLKMLA